MAVVKLDWTDAYIEGMSGERWNDKVAKTATRLSSEIEDGRLPFIKLPYLDKLLVQLDDMKERLKPFEHMLVLGIGGSALGARALQKAFFPGQDLPGHGGPWLWICDNVDPGTVEALFNRLPVEKTIVVVVSKSGGTIETASQYFLACNWLKENLGDTWRDNLLLVTDPERGSLRQEAETYNIKSLPVPENLGGRYSVLSAVGLVPAMFAGMDYRSLALGAHTAAGKLRAPGLNPRELEEHPAWQLAVWNRALMERGYTELIFFNYIPLWGTFGDWFAQLWAESLGKEGKGTMPLASVGVTDQHSVNQMYLDGPRNKACLFLTCSGLPAGLPFPKDVPDDFEYLRGRNFGDLIQAEALGTRMALTKSRVPLVGLDFANDSAFAAGKLIMLMELMTLMTGWLMDINPLDQPAVELGKRLAKARLGADGLTKEKTELSSFLEGKRDIREF